MNKDLTLIIACAFIGLGLITVVVTQLGPPGSIQQFKVPSPFLQICSTEECMDEVRFKALKPEERVVSMNYGEGWVNLDYQDGSSRMHSGIRNAIIQEYIDDQYYKHKKEPTAVTFDADWIELSYGDGSKELISGLDKTRSNAILFQLNR